MSLRRVVFFQFWQSAIIGGRAETACFALIALSIFSLAASYSQAELKPEPIPNVVSLATPYPAGYAIVHDLAFGSLIDSSFSLVDINTRRFKGMISAGQFSTIDFSVGRQKYYVGETVHSRGSRGQRQDVIAIYDFADLKLVGEVDLPPKRMNMVVNESSTAITADDRFMLVFNMNPGTSITVIDLDEEAIVSEIQTPGCYMLYPGLKSSFFMMCGNGSLVSIGLDEKGQETERWSSAVFNDIDRDPLSEKAAFIQGVWYMVTYAGEVQPIDASEQRPVIRKRWWLTSEAERAANWRPAGWHGKSGHEDGLLWVAMTENGYEGSHKDPATHVWVYDLQESRRILDIELKIPALSIATTKGKQPKLLVVNIEGSLDVYEGIKGTYLQSIHQLGETPFMVHAID